MNFLKMKRKILTAIKRADSFQTMIVFAIMVLYIQHNHSLECVMKGQLYVAYTASAVNI